MQTASYCEFMSVAALSCPEVIILYNLSTSSMMVSKPCGEGRDVQVPFVAVRSTDTYSLYLYAILCNGRNNSMLGSNRGGKDNEEGIVETQLWTCTRR